jgi:predicted HTH domain antitoxin
VNLEISDDMVSALKVTPERLREELLLAAAVKLFELGRLSSGAAARLAGVPVPVFLGKLADYGATVFRGSEGEIRGDARRA